MDVVRLVQLVEQLLTIALSAYTEVKNAIEDAENLTPEQKQELIDRLKKAQKNIPKWEEL